MRYSLLRITDKCNQRCVFCNVPPRGPSAEYPRSFEEVRGRLAATAGADSIILSGGEPTISKRLGEVVSLARAHGIRRIELQTNATMMASPPFAESIGRLGLDNLLVSLHSHDAATSDALTRAPGTFALTLKGIGNLNRLGVPITLNFVINALNHPQLPAFVEFFRARTDLFRPANTLCFSFVQPNGDAWEHGTGIVPRLRDAVPHLEEALDACVEHGLRFAISESGIPVCLVERFRDRHQEYQRCRAGVSDALAVTNASQKIKRGDCAGCTYSPHCLGIWRSYAMLYGLGELRPVAREAT